MFKKNSFVLVVFTTAIITLLNSCASKAEPQKITGFVDTHIHAFDCRKDGLDIVSKWMDRMNVSYAIVHPLRHSIPKNDAQRKLMLENYKKFKGKIFRFCIIFPEQVKTLEEAVKILEQEKKDGAIGFGEHYGVGLKFDDPNNLMFYEACSRVGLPVMFHIDQKRNMDEKGLPRLENVLKKFPDVNMIAHSFWWRQIHNGACERLLQKYPNLYADLSPGAVKALSRMDKEKARAFVIKNADKLLFGTDAGWWSFAKIPAPEKQWNFFETLDLPQDVKDKIYRQNAIKLLNLKGR